MKKIILVLSALCFAGAALILVLMPKPEKKLPTLPEANFVCEISSTEFRSDGVIEIIKYPILSAPSDAETADFMDFNSKLRTKLKDELYNSDFPLEEGQTASYLIQNGDVTLAAGDFLSFKYEGLFSNVEENYYSTILRSLNMNVKTGEEIAFEDVVSNIHKFEKAFGSGKFTAVKSDEYNSGKSSLEILGNYSPENGIYPEWYVDGVNFVVIARAPSALGGLTEYKIPLIEAEDFLNHDSELIGMIFEGK